MPAPYSTAKNPYYGKFATTSRLVACLVSEGLVNAYYCPQEPQQQQQQGQDGTITGLCMLMRIRGSADKIKLSSARVSSLDNNVLTVIPLRGVPELDMGKKTTVNGVQCYKIGLVDPWDMLPHIYSPQAYVNNTFPNTLADSETIYRQVIQNLTKLGFRDAALADGYDAVQLWQQFAHDFGVTDKLTDLIASELASSMIHQTYTYDYPKPLPTLESSSIQWEQSIVEGHATHPMHKARRSYPPLPPLNPGQVNLETPKLRLLSIPRSSMQLRGEFETLAAPLVDAILEKTGNARELRAKHADHVLMPVHEFQIPNVLERFKDASVLPEANNVTAHSLTSIRSVAIPDVLKDLTVKLCVGIKVSSALRTITPYTTYFGPGFSANVVPRLSYDRKVLTIERELASAVYSHPDTDVAKHCSCVLREAIEYPSNPTPNDDVIIVAAALVEKIQKPDTQETLATHVWNLDTEEKRIAFLDRYIQLALKAFIPPALENGVAFEAHGQNTMCRFDRRTGELKGFVIRDFGGVKAHNPTLKKSCGVELDVLPDSCVVAHSMDEVYKLLYHTLFHSQFQRLIRVLGMHHNGRGWEMVRTHLAELIPRDHPMYQFFMVQEKVPGKCLIRMKIEELYRDYIYSPVPNMILSRPQELVQ
ncbi:IucC family-domain-containing protein [Zychaea mexicana]|uniref:IucC family-domain-containing protein n=1 Tax=Zychaea mexicana TaxID=64656 RepID=UPI0022FED12B|nr:IucC family-domain-containing protein [Zychaea mexicana]KAI9496318.1 IucC family-domain-containing protein [Zychaea mexicana]